MSFPNLPDIKPEMDLDKEQVVNLLLASIASEELSLAHMINAEAEKIQFVIGTLEEHKQKKSPTIEDLLEINRSVDKTLRSVIKKQMLLQFKLEDTTDIIKETPPPTPPPTTSTTTTSTTTSSSSSSSTTTKWWKSNDDSCSDSL
ncbi:hypothetical protein [Natranaerobius trueperi]|uniref:hypothetical protein n=1 Tax=Natranaerobius trueperi TaxID=759412 RepID=UPI00197BB3F9|nr:hypothetical protein [Natranaerobius trueperi]